MIFGVARAIERLLFELMTMTGADWSGCSIRTLTIRKLYSAAAA